MTLFKRYLPFIIGLFLISCGPKQISISWEGDGPARVDYGIDKLKTSLQSFGYEVILDGEGDINISLTLSEDFERKESFSIASSPTETIIQGADASGLMYACLHLVDKVNELKKLPDNYQTNQSPDMILRGTCIGLQKTTYLPDRQVYEYPYTPESFPWFYNKDLWIKYLDMMVENRYNSLYLWNGHPFASLVKLADYPYALEVDEETFKKNEEIFTFLTKEADKRGIWVIQMFYNIILSKPFAEHHGIKTQDRSRPILPIAADYTRKSIAAFVEKYPNVGLLVALGEAMQGIENDVSWFTKTIIPGVKDGLKATGQKTQPPIVLRGHDTNASIVMENALPLYGNLYTLNKYNGESLTTYEPRGKWAEYHKSLSELGSTHIDNVHVLANLEPFRYGSPDFIQKSTKAMKSVHGANGLHLYPQTSYWDWPFAPDKTEPKLLEMDRDWIWYKAWGRYAWDADLDREGEIKYWSALLSKKFGCGDCGKEILQAYEASGEISPMIQRRFGITEGNRQTMTLGMFMSQLVSPEKYSLNKMVYESHGPEGELLSEYAEREFSGEPHTGETPLWAADKLLDYADEAVKAIETAKGINMDKDEFLRIKNDIYCYEAMAQFYSAKAKAAISVLNYGYSKDIDDLEAAVPLLEKSINSFEELVYLTKGSYFYANSMQTQQRRIPIGGNDGKNKTWVELLPFYQEELGNFKRNIALLKSTSNDTSRISINPLTPVQVQLLSKSKGNFDVKIGASPFSEKQYKIEGFAEELKNLQGIKYSFKDLDDKDTEVKFIAEKPVKLVIGFFQSDKTEFLSPPTLEHDATANFYGQADIKILNAMRISGLPPLNVHTYSFDAGTHSLLFDNDVFLVLGFIEGSESIKPRDAGFGVDGKAPGLDWLFY